MYIKYQYSPEGDSKNRPELKHDNSSSSATTESPVSLSISTHIAPQVTVQHVYSASSVSKWDLKESTSDDSERVS